MRVAVDLTAVRKLDTGVERVALAAFRALAEARSEAEWIVFARDGVAARWLADTGARTIEVPGLTRSGRVLWQQLQLPRELRLRKADLLFAPVYTAPLASPCPVLLYVHDLIALEHPELCTRTNVLHFRALLGPAIRRASRVAVPSRTVAGAVQRRFGLSRDPSVIPPGIAGTFLSPAAAADEEARRRLGLPERYVLAVGRLEPKKNTVTVVRAVARAAARHERLALVVVGADGPSARETLRTARDSNVRIHLLQRLSDEDLARVYSMSECLVFPSLAEGFGIPPLESLAAGTPALVSAHTPSFTERWEGDPWILPSLAPAAVGEMVRTVRSEDSRAHAKTKRERIRELTWENHARALLGLMGCAAGC